MLLLTCGDKSQIWRLSQFVLANVTVIIATFSILEKHASLTCFDFLSK